MEKRISITAEENETVYTLFSTYTSYMDVLQYLINQNVQQNSIFDQKWNEAIQLNIKLTEEKRKIEKKYRPLGNWDRFEFNFDESQVVFIKNET